MYPSVPDSDTRDGSVIARNFIQGLVVVGLGEVDKHTKTFKRFDPNHEACHDREYLRQKWEQLGLPLDDY